eukprot:sb/3472613/
MIFSEVLLVEPQLNRMIKCRRALSLNSGWKPKGIMNIDEQPTTEREEKYAIFNNANRLRANQSISRASHVARYQFEFKTRIRAFAVRILKNRTLKVRRFLSRFYFRFFKFVRPLECAAIPSCARPRNEGLQRMPSPAPCWSSNRQPQHRGQMIEPNVYETHCD